MHLVFENNNIISLRKINKAKQSK